jgi:hypothetical protein
MSTVEETTAVVTTADAQVNESETTTPVVVAEDKGNIPGEMFCRVWEQSATRSEALKTFHELGYSLEYGSLIARAKSFTKKGVNLKKMPREKTTGRKGKTLDVSKLNAVVAEVSGDATKVKNAAEGSDSTPAS